MSKSGGGVTSAQHHERARTTPAAEPKAPRLRLPSASRAEHDHEVLRAVRRFHVGGGSAAGGRLEGLLPALLDTYRGAGTVRTDYPLLFEPAAGAAESGRCRPLSEALEGLAASAEVGRVLHDNLRRLERQVFVRLEDDQSPAPPLARPLLAAATRAMREELALPESQSAALDGETERLLEAIPEHALILGYGPTVPVMLLALAVKEQRRRAGASWSAELERLGQGLAALLEVDDAKRRVRQPDALGRTLGGGAASRLLDPVALVHRLESRRGGSPPMDDQRRRRVEQALAGVRLLARETDDVVRGRCAPLLLLCEPALRDELPTDGAAELCRVETAVDPCAEIARRFDSAAAALGERLAAVRTAHLELEGVYDPERHDPWLAELDWRAFAPAELHLLSPMAAVLTADLVAESGMVALSRLLLSGRPLQVLVLADPAGNPGGGDGAPGGFRFEPGYLGIGHREAFVSQISSAHPLRMAAAFDRGVGSMRTALHVVAGGRPATAVADLSPILVAGAAVEGRAHPFFRFDPRAGESWARRFELDGNPEPTEDWPTVELEVERDGGKETLLLPFTFADFALLDPRYAACFAPLPDGLSSDDLVPLDRWLALERDEAAHLVPFVWAADREGLLHRVAVSRALALACRDRLGYWHTLQELAGLHNEHVLGAEERVRREWEDRLAVQRSELEVRHRAELEAVRARAAEEVVEALTTGLLGDGDSSVFVGPPGSESGAAVAAAPSLEASANEGVGGEVAAPGEPAPESTVRAPQHDEDEEAIEPWIDTPLCTSCNDCINLNPRLFAYDQDKKAYIEDARAGTFAELVRAAEQCPARIIHPGTPLDPSEEGLAELVQRAAELA